MIAELLAISLASFFQEDPSSPDDEPLPRFEAEFDAWSEGASGWIFITRGSRPGTATRAREGHEFGVDSAILPVVGARLRFWDAHTIGIRAVSTVETGSHISTGDFVYHGETYPGGTSVHSEVGFLLVDLDYQVRCPLSEGLILTPHLGAQYWGFSSKLRTEGGGNALDESRKFSSGYWLGGADVEVGVYGPWMLKGTFVGGMNGLDRFFMEAEGALQLRLTSWGKLSAAYRVQQVRFHTSTNEANLLFQGPSLGFELSF